MRSPLAAVTGGTGFIGRHVALALAAQGWRLRLLSRSGVIPSPITELSPDIVFGDLDDDDTLNELVHGADAVIHAAGMIKARAERDFFGANASGSERIAKAVRLHAPEAHFVVISSLVAREPHLSAYAASKRAGEDAAIAACGTALPAVLRPAAVYGPWDRETFRVFWAARRSLLVVPASDGRISLLHVADLADAVAAVAADRSIQGIFEITDSRWTGYSWSEIVAAVAAAIGTSPRVVRIPAAVLHVAAPMLVLGRLSRTTDILSPGKLREILHEDWSSTPAAQLPATTWNPKISLDRGFSETARWYFDNGWMTPVVRSG